MAHLAHYLDEIQAQGKRGFTIKEAENTLGISHEAIKSALYRLKHKGEIVTLLRGYYIILPPEYRILGCLPAEQVIPLIMQHLKLDYYVGLLSAAMHYGASHQKPQVYQVVTEKQCRSIHCGQIKIQFLVKKNIKKVPTQKKVVSTGYLKISSPEVTAMDLLLYSKASGGLNHIATVLTELVEELNVNRLLEIAKNSDEIAWVQRLGYLLEVIEPLEVKKTRTLVNALKKFINKANPQIIPLHWKLPMNNAERNHDWRVAINTTIESDI